MAEKNPEYWPQYHKNRQQRRQKDCIHQSVKMDALDIHFHLIPGKYEISIRLFSRISNGRVPG
jgi:hypothetical protein